MSTVEMDSFFATALREALVVAVKDTPRYQRRWRWRIGTGSFVGLTLVAGGVALAAGLFSPPGAPVDTPLGNVVIATHTGTATIELGPPPATATSVSLSLTCLTVGKFTFPNGSYASCGTADVTNPPDLRQISEVVPITSGMDSVTIKTSAAASWTLQAVYVNRVTTPWAINSHGETYGAPNQNGTPDLIAVTINHGATQGYVKASNLSCASGGDVTSISQALAWDKASANRNVTIPVFESDGTTVIGTFVLGDASGPNATTVPLSSLSKSCSSTQSGIPHNG